MSEKIQMANQVIIDGGLCVPPVSEHCVCIVVYSNENARRQGSR